MAGQDWGHCNRCRFFASPAQLPLGDEEADCKHPELSRFALKVFGACGCTGFELRSGISDELESPIAPSPI